MGFLNVHVALAFGANASDGAMANRNVQLNIE